MSEINIYNWQGNINVWVALEDETVTQTASQVRLAN